MKGVKTIIKMVLFRANKTQNWLSERTKIPKNKISDLVHGKAVPRPDEITLIDRELDQSGKLVRSYCSDVCPAGKYAGYRFSDSDMKSAEIRLISGLTVMDKHLPELADMLCKGKLSQEILARLSQIKLSIMALEVKYANGVGKASSKDITVLQEFAEQKRKAACGGAQTASRR